MGAQKAHDNCHQLQKYISVMAKLLVPWSPSKGAQNAHNNERHGEKRHTHEGDLEIGDKKSS